MLLRTFNFENTTHYALVESFNEHPSINLNHITIITNLYDKNDEMKHLTTFMMELENPINKELYNKMVDDLVEETLQTIDDSICNSSIHIIKDIGNRLSTLLPNKAISLKDVHITIELFDNKKDMYFAFPLFKTIKP